jgi:hypothetical protein
MLADGAVAIWSAERRGHHEAWADTASSRWVKGRTGWVVVTAEPMRGTEYCTYRPNGPVGACFRVAAGVVQPARALGLEWRRYRRVHVELNRWPGACWGSHTHSPVASLEGSMIEFIALNALAVLLLGLGVLVGAHLLAALGLLVVRGVRRSELVRLRSRTGGYRSPGE